MNIKIETKSDPSPLVTLQESKEDVERQQQQELDDQPVLEVWFPIVLPFWCSVADHELAIHQLPLVN